MISKELLSEVLNIKQFCNGKYLKENCFGYPRVKMKGYPFTLNDDEEFAIRENELCYGFINIVKNPYREVADFKFINIYELAHKCKEWANNKEFHLWSMQNECQLETFKSSHNLDIEHFMADTEPEAIFKACEWILKDKR